MNSNIKNEENMAYEMGRKGSANDINRADLFSMCRGPIEKIWDKVIALFEALKMKGITPGLKVLIVGALLYLISPIDAIPDQIPIAGLLDDAALIISIFEKYVHYLQGGFSA